MRYQHVVVSGEPNITMVEEATQSQTTAIYRDSDYC
ncbi:iron-containing alcohol dehydrogenase [Vibrio cholerae]|nr:iron-containing alcohol dehydrogenase [Vibrio cholerae]